jgi:DNA helicase II / ATP-dependent DNA helicase PcrA
MKKTIKCLLHTLNGLRRKIQPVLRDDKRSRCNGCEAMNFGISKGMTFDRVLIFPTALMAEWLSPDLDQHIDGSRAKTYVAITRARYSVTFVHSSVGIAGPIYFKAI